MNKRNKLLYLFVPTITHTQVTERSRDNVYSSKEYVTQQYCHYGRINIGHFFQHS